MKHFSDLSERERTIAIERSKILDLYNAYRKGGFTVVEACAEVEVSNPTISRWSRAFREYGIVGLADKKSKRRGGQSKMTKEQKGFLYKTTLAQPQPNLRAIYRNNYLQFCASLDQKPVSYTTFLREFKNIPENVKTLYQEGLMGNKA